MLGRNVLKQPKYYQSKTPIVWKITYEKDGKEHSEYVEGVKARHAIARLAQERGKITIKKVGFVRAGLI